MILGKRLINTGVEAACLTDDVNPFTGEVADGGVALYTLDYDGSDASGNHDGTPDSAVEFGVAGVTNYGARFSSNTTGIVNTSLQLNSTAHSISLWVKPAAVVSGRWNTIFMSTFLGYPSGFIGKRFDQSTSFHYRTESGNELYFTLASADTWYHIVVTRDSGGVDIYVDGSFVTSNSDSMGSYATSFYERTAIGSNPLYPGEYFDGDIDQVRIFNKVLSTDEIAALYNSGAGETACVYTCTTDTVNYPSGTTPVAYYKLDNSAEDETGSYDGTETNIEYRFGRFGQAAVFNGSSSKIVTTLNPNGFSQIAISCWIKTDLSSGIGSGHIVSANDGTNWCFLSIDKSTGIVTFGASNGGSSIFLATHTGAINDGNWHHVVGNYNGTNATLYIDNTGYTPVSATASLSVNIAFGIGYRNTAAASGTYYDGKIDQVRIYSTALDSDQVSQLYNEKQCYITKDASDPFGDSSEVAFYEMENNANDTSGNGNNGTASGATFLASDPIRGTYVARFDGTSDFIDTNIAPADLGNEITFSCWFKTSTTGLEQTIFDSGGHSSSFGGVVVYLITTNVLRFRSSTGAPANNGYTDDGTTNVADGEWHHVILSFSSNGDYFMNLDGNEEISGTSTALFTQPYDTPIIGAYIGNTSLLEFNGDIDQVRIFDRALDGTEAYQLYAEGARGTGL